MLCAFTALPKNASFCYQYTVLHEKGQCAALISGRFVNKIRNCSTNSAMFCIIYGMESKWQKKRDRETKWKVTLRRIRIPLLTVLGAFFVALVGFPLLLNSVTSEALSAEFPIGVPSATPLPLPTEGQPLAIEQILPEEEPAQSPEDAESTVSSVPEQTPDLSAYTTLQAGDEDPMVAKIQVRLTELYYLDSDEPSNTFGTAIVDALKRFQRSHFMKETGIADPLTQQILFSESAKAYVITQGYSGQDVTDMQYRLAELGYYFDKTNGYFGVATTRALTAFQAKNGISANGEADYDTRDLLYSPDARPAVDPTPTPTPEPEKTTPKPSNTPKPADTQKPSSTPKPADTPAPTATQNAWWNPDAEQDDPTPTPQRTASPSQGIEQVGSGVSAFIQAALAQQGKPYVLGGRGPDEFDCSGLVYYALRSAGVEIGRYSARNYAKVEEWETIYGKENLIPGDLLFYKSSGTSDTTITHVAIWLGSNKLVHASSSRSSVVTTTWSSWSDENFLFAKRVF